MNDISKPGGGIRPKKSVHSENRGGAEYSSQERVSIKTEHSRRPEKPEQKERTGYAPRKQESREKDRTRETAGAGTGTIDSSVRSLEERDQKRQNNPFLQKLKDKRAGVENRMSHGGDFNNKGLGKWKYVFGGLLVVLLFWYVFFPSTSVDVTPRVENASLNNTEFTALASSTAPLSYETMTVSQQASGEAQATAAQETEEKASGELTIYNTYTQEPQRLVRNTRFRSPEGLIYKVNDSVTIPGMQGNTPGQVTVTVYADQPGEDYNFTETGAKFTIPGFENSPALFEGFYAETQTALDGGYSGISKVVSDEELERVTNEVSETLRTQLFEQARADMAEGYILFEEAGDVTYETNVEDRAELESDSARVNVTGTLEARIFEKTKLAQAIAESQISEYEGEELSVTNWDDVSYAQASTTAEDEGEDTETENVEELVFVLSGPVSFYWNVPVGEMARSLAGTEKARFDNNMNQYRYQISGAEAHMRPFWRDTFPTVPADITIDVEDA